MRLLKQVRLYFQEGTSDKVYEIDLCEIASGRCVVNYRFGRRGSRLREGSHTAAPVSHAEAERAFDALADSKRRKGYRDFEPGSSTAPARPPAAARAAAAGAAARAVRPPAEFRAQAVLRRLQAGPRGGRWPIERAIWRAGELGIRGAVPILLRLLGGGAMRDYCIVWALGRIGDEAAIEPLVNLWRAASTPDMVRRISVEALRLLGSDAMRAEMARDLFDELPGELRRAAQSGHADALLAALQRHVSGSDPARYEVLETLYQIDTEQVRPALIAFLRTAPLSQHYFQRLRHLFKAAELRRDGEVFGLLAYRFAKEPAAARVYGSRSRAAFAATTRHYLQLRVWRTLRRLAAIGDRDFVKLAVGTLLPFVDADAVPARSVARNHWDRFAPYWAFNHLLYGRSPRYKPQRNAKAWRCKSGYRPGEPEPAQHIREEAFPALWTDQPGGLLHLLAESECTPVHQFASKALRACPNVLAELDGETLLLLLSRPYEVTAQLAAEIAARRYQPMAPDLPLVLAMASCASASGRAQAHRFIEEGRGSFLIDGDFLFALCTNRHGDTREVALRLLRSSSLPDAAARTLIGRLLASLLKLAGDDAARAQARDIGAILLQGLGQSPSSPLRSVAISAIFDLLRHPLSDVQELGASLLLQHQSGVAALSNRELDELLSTLLSSNTESLRALGMRLLAQLPDVRLSEQQGLLRTLCTHSLADLRNASRPLIRRLASLQPAFAAAIVPTLISVLRSAEPHDGVHRHVLGLLREDLTSALRQLRLADVIELASVESTAALELAGHLLAAQPQWAEELPTAAIVRLAHVEVRAVREAAWLYFQRIAPRLHRDPAELSQAVRIAESKWEDTREFAFRMLREEFTAKDYTAEILIGICDSVKPDVQALGRELITRHFNAENGPEYLLKLSQHPSTDLQLFATNYLESFAAGQPERLRALQHYFLSVLSRVNQARLAKRRVHDFLLAEATKSAEAAQLASEILGRVSATVAIGDRARAIETLLAISAQHPSITVPIVRQSAPLREAGKTPARKPSITEGRGAV